MIRVRAKQLGFYGNVRRREGDVFDIAHEKHFSERWMERTEAPMPQPAAGKAEGAPDQDPPPVKAPAPKDERKQDPHPRS